MMLPVAWQYIKLDIHHRSNPFGGLLSRPVPFSVHKIWSAVHKSDCANWKTITYGQAFLPWFQNGFLSITHTNDPPSPFCGFRFCERGPLSLTPDRISAL
ncbi:hypothetical protein AVEN_52599-1 [Araneus ventricosus]|uniref:Uncharacterized protein n=1 Tax=Araneus ventricosus TaxID=182803 RepID=A0A4Y2ESC5_ARAVE|nr:hypothetical protein AVEN_52599-1 [Araneus ventricosus]